MGTIDIGGKDGVTGWLRRHFLPRRDSPPAVPSGHLVETTECYIYLEDDSSQRLTFQMMPEEIMDAKSATWSPVAPVGRGEPYRIYQGSTPRVINLELQFFVSTDQGDGGTTDQVMAKVEWLRSLVYPEESGGLTLHPPVVVLLLGDFVSMRSVVHSVSVRYKAPWRSERPASGAPLETKNPDGSVTVDTPTVVEFRPHYVCVGLVFEEVSDIVPTSTQIRSRFLL